MSPKGELPVVLIHGYSSEGRNKTVEDIYGDLPYDLRKRFPQVLDINLSRWISLSDGITIDDVSFAMNRALNSNRYKRLLTSGFHVVTHSTGALVVRNWIKLFSDKPCPIANLVHLAGANLGSGLAHVGKGELARWARKLQLTGSGIHILDELEFGASKTLDLHRHFLQPGCDMYHDYEVQEFGLIGSQTLGPLRVVPIRYVKEDSSDNTVRTSASNLNFNYVRIAPHDSSHHLPTSRLRKLHEERLDDRRLSETHYDIDLSGLAANRREIPFTVLYETAHFGGDIGIVDGDKNRNRVLPHLVKALSTPRDANAYSKVVDAFHANTAATQSRVARLKRDLRDWNKKRQYEAHAQVVCRVRDQFGRDVNHPDITFKSSRRGRGRTRLETLIEDKHWNRVHPGTVTFYLRTQEFGSGGYRSLLPDCRALDIEVTAAEPGSDEIRYLPLTVRLSRDTVPRVIQDYRTTVVDITLLRLPSQKVFALSLAKA